MVKEQERQGRRIQDSVATVVSDPKWRNWRWTWGGKVTGRADVSFEHAGNVSPMSQSGVERRARKGGVRRGRSYNLYGLLCLGRAPPSYRILPQG